MDINEINRIFEEVKDELMTDKSISLSTIIRDKFSLPEVKQNLSRASKKWCSENREAVIERMRLRGNKNGHLKSPEMAKSIADSNRRRSKGEVQVTFKDGKIITYNSMKETRREVHTLGLTMRDVTWVLIPKP